MGARAQTLCEWRPGDQRVQRIQQLAADIAATALDVARDHGPRHANVGIDSLETASIQFAAIAQESVERPHDLAEKGIAEGP